MGLAMCDQQLVQGICIMLARSRMDWQDLYELGTSLDTDGLIGGE